MIRESFLDIMGLYRYRPDLFDMLEFPEGIDKGLAVDAILFDNRDLELHMPNGDFMKYMIGFWGRSNSYTFETLLKTTMFEYNPIDNYDRIEWAKDRMDRDLQSDSTHTRNLKDVAVEERNLTDTTREERNLRDTETEERNSRDTVTEGNWRDTVTPNLVTTAEDTPGNVQTTSRTGYNSGEFKGAEQVAMSGKDIRKETQGGTHVTERVYTSDHVTEYGGNNTVTTEYGGERTDTTEYRGDKTNTVDYTGNENTLDKDTGNTVDEHWAHLHGNIGVTTTQEMIRQEREIAMFNLYKTIARLFAEEFCVLVY